MVLARTEQLYCELNDESKGCRDSDSQPKTTDKPRYTPQCIRTDSPSLSLRDAVNKHRDLHQQSESEGNVYKEEERNEQKSA